MSCHSKMFFRPQKESSQPIFLPSTVQNFENLKTFFELLYMINFNTHASDPSPPNQFTHKIKQRGKNPCKFCSKIWKGAVSIAKKESIPKFDQNFFLLFCTSKSYLRKVNTRRIPKFKFVTTRNICRFLFF